MMLAHLVRPYEPAHAPPVEATDPNDPLASILAAVDLPSDGPDEAALLKARVLRNRLPKFDLPVAALSSVRKVADSLSFPLVPFGALSEQSWAEEKPRVQHAILGFTKLAEDAGLKVYALTPGLYFDMHAYIERCGGAPCYGGGKASAFSALHITAGLLGEMVGDIAAVRKDVTSLAQKQAADFDTLSRGIRSVERRLTDVENGRKAEAAALHQARWEAFRRNKAWLLVRPCDPLLLAIDGDDPGTARLALVGPCWGPDIDPALLRQMQAGR